MLLLNILKTYFFVVVVLFIGPPLNFVYTHIYIVVVLLLLEGGTMYVPLAHRIIFV